MSHWSIETVSAGTSLEHQQLKFWVIATAYPALEHVVLHKPLDMYCELDWPVPKLVEEHKFKDTAAAAWRQRRATASTRSMDEG